MQGAVDARSIPSGHSVGSREAAPPARIATFTQDAVPLCDPPHASPNGIVYASMRFLLVGARAEAVAGILGFD